MELMVPLSACTSLCLWSMIVDLYTCMKVSSKSIDVRLSKSLQIRKIPRNHKSACIWSPEQAKLRQRSCPKQGYCTEFNAILKFKIAFIISHFCDVPDQHVFGSLGTYNGLQIGFELVIILL